MPVIVCLFFAGPDRHPRADLVFDGANELVRQAIVEVEELFARHQVLLEAVRDALLDRDTLTERELDELLRRHGQKRV